MCRSIPAPTTESKDGEGKEIQTNPVDPKPQDLTELFDAVVEEAGPVVYDAPMPISMAPPSGGDVIYLRDPEEQARELGITYADLGASYTSGWGTWKDSDDNKPDLWDPEPTQVDERNWMSSTDCSIEPSKDETLPSGVVCSTDYSIEPPKDEILPSGVGAGLSNLGNTCFMNAILQCFTHTVPLIQGLRSCGHSFPCDGYNNGFCVICVLRDQIESSLAVSGGKLSPLKLVSNLNYFSSTFRRFQQEDAHEFMQCALDKLDRCFLDLKEKNNSSEEVNLVESIFGGRLISKLRCSNCGHSSDTFEPLIDMSLEIENVDSLPSALESFTKVEHIDANFKCDGCKEEVSLEKQLLLDQTPTVAAFHLKRFKTDGSFVEKLDKHVDFPLKLDLQPYSISDQNSNAPAKYDLYAVVVHIGLAATSGHYFCYVRSAPDVWHKLDDSKVTMVSADSVLSQEAYILFYAKQDTPWFSSIMESTMPCWNSVTLNTSPKSVLDRVDSSFKSAPIITENVVKGEAGGSKEFSEKQSDYLCKERLDLPVAMDTGDASHGCKQFRKLNQGIADLNALKDTIQAQVPLGKNKTILNVSALVGGKSHVESGGSDKNNRIEEVDDFGKNNDGFHYLTPPSSPTPDSPDRKYCIPRDHLKENSGSCKKSKSKHVVSSGDSERKAATSYISKMRGSRKAAFMDLVECAKEAPSNKRKEVDSSLCKEGSHHSASKKSNHASVMRPVAAGSSQ